jgi:hypothetical protein
VGRYDIEQRQQRLEGFLEPAAEENPWLEVPQAILSRLYYMNPYNPWAWVKSIDPPNLNGLRPNKYPRFVHSDEFCVGPVVPQ